MEGKDPLDELFLRPGISYIVDADLWNKLIEVLKSHKKGIEELQKRVSPATPSEKCPHCKGTGKMATPFRPPNDVATCPDCFGTGKRNA